MTDYPENSQLTVQPKKSQGLVSKYAPEVWTKAQDLVENRPDISISDIARKVGMPITTLESKASRNGWLNKRDLSKVRKADESLKKITREIAFQINDLHSHAIAMLEAAQYSFRIKITRDKDGKMHYVNFDDFPDRPLDWETLSEDAKEAYRRYIPPPRLKAFHEQIHFILEREKDTIEFVTKMTKASLPKIDPDIIDMTSRASEENDILDNTGIFKAGPKADTDTTNVDELIEKLEE